MSDDADIADQRIEERISDGINESSRYVAAMPKGEAGECEYCGNAFSRVVDGLCGHCRDRLARARR